MLYRDYRKYKQIGQSYDAMLQDLEYLDANEGILYLHNKL